MLLGGSLFHQVDSFAMMRGGHLDYCVLRAFQVAANGDLPKWHTGAPYATPAVGGAVDLAIGAKKTFVMMEHRTKAGEPRHGPWFCWFRGSARNRAVWVTAQITLLCKLMLNKTVFDFDDIATFGRTHA